MLTVLGHDLKNLKWICDSCGWAGDFLDLIHTGELGKDPYCPTCWAEKESNHSKRCREEMTSDVIFLVQSRMVTHEGWEEEFCLENWNTETVTLTRPEGERYGKRNNHHFPNGWRVYGIPAHGDLARMIKKT